MSLFKEDPRLFTNGRFMVDWHEEQQFQLLGYTVEDNGKLRVRTDSITKKWCFIGGCKLVARPIEDMTDDELKAVVTINDAHLLTETRVREKRIEILKRKANTLNFFGVTERKLADFGVYFGPQYHFEDSTVIDSRDVE